jgi:hypothetical protein
LRKVEALLSGRRAPTTTNSMLKNTGVTGLLHQRELEVGEEVVGAKAELRN